MNKKLNVYILDDEEGSIVSLKAELLDFEEIVNFVGFSQDPLVALKELPKKNIDVLFLDIEMPNLNGFEFLKRYGECEFEVIFTTAYDEFALKAFEVSAIDYLLKPIDSDDLSRALTKIKSNTFKREQFDILFDMLLSKSNDFDRMALPTLEGLEFVEIKKIVRCESESNYATIFKANNQKIVVSKPLKFIENKLSDKGFLRIHNSHLVNVNYIKKYRKGRNGSVELMDGSIIPISRNRKDYFLNFFIK